MTTHDKAVFDDTRNIVVGQARIIYAPDEGAETGRWALPGGVKTTDYLLAQDVARQIDQMIKRMGG